MTIEAIPFASARPMPAFSDAAKKLTHAETLRLIGEASEGSDQATRTLVVRLLPVIRSRVRQRLGHASQVGAMQERDLIQEVWLVLFKNHCALLRMWAPERGCSLEGYVRMIVDREVGNLSTRARAKKRACRTVELDAVAEPTDDRPGPESLLIERHTAEDLWAHLAGTLSPRGQEVLERICLERASIDEIAAAMGVKRQVIYNWRCEIRKVVRSFLHAQGEVSAAESARDLQ